MPLLNYTTSIEAAKTVSEIERILSYHHAKSILKNYDGQGCIESLSFQIDTPHGLAEIRLPIDPDAVLRVMMRDRAKGSIPHRLLTRQQAIRVAWRIIKDWIQAQMAILETEMVKMDQIFLPYIVTTSGTTLFQVFESRKMLTQGKDNAQ